MGKRDPGKIIGSLDAIGRRMDALRAGALTTEEAIAKAAAKATELREMFPLDIDALFEPGMSPVEQLDALKKYQDTGFGGPKPSDIQGTQAQNIPKQTLADLAAMSPEAQMAALRGGVGPGMSTGPATAMEGYQWLPWGELGTPERTLLNRRELGVSPVNMQEANDFADKLEAAAKRFNAGFPNSYFTAIVLEMEIPYLRIGARSAAEAKNYIRGLGSSFLSGFIASLTSPTMPPDLRALTSEAISILQTGEVGAGGTSLGGSASRTAGGLSLPGQTAPRVPASAVSGGSTTAGIGGGELATAGIGAGLGATAGAPATAGQVAGIQAAVREQVSEVRRANQDLAAQWRAMQGWQQRVEANYLRPVQEGIVRANRELAESFRWQRQAETNYFRPLRREVSEMRQFAALGANQTRELSMALERFNLSGALSGG